MRLQRKWARTVIVLYGGTLLCMLWMAVVLPRDPRWAYLPGGAAIVLLFAGTVIRLRHLGCPNCGRSVAGAQWKPGRRYYCPRCGKPFVYDDEDET